MDVKNLELEAISFNQAPTKSQLVHSLRSISNFISDMGASLMLDRSYDVSDPPLGQMLNAAIQLKACAKTFDEGPNSSGLSLPQPVPGQGPQRVR